MNEIQDNQLLRDYARDASQTAFASLARRYAGLVFHVAMRCTGSAELAEEAAQNAFVILARKADRIDASSGLASWLHRTVFFEASKLRDREGRYQKRIASLAERIGNDQTEDGSWEGTAPILDHVLNDLRPDDLKVILLRFYEGCSYREMVSRFGSEEATWRKRCNRAVERLREKLASRGANVKTTVLIAALAALLPQSAPAALVESLARVTALATAQTGILLMTNAKVITLAACLLVVAGFVVSSMLRDKPAQTISAAAPPADSENNAEELAAAEPTTVPQFDAEQRRAWLNAFREHLYERGAPHSQVLTPPIGGLGRSRRDGKGPGRSAIHEFADRTGGDASEVIAILKEALYSDRATVAYRALGYWGWVRDFAGADGAKCLIEFAGKTENLDLAMYAMNILGQYKIDPDTDMPARFIELIQNGSQNAKIALSYYGGGFAQREGMESMEDMLLPLLKNQDQPTRYAAARILSQFPDRRDAQLFAALLDIPSGLESYHYEHLLSELLEMPVEAAEPNREKLTSLLTDLRSKPSTKPQVYEALLKFKLADSEAASIETWKTETAALAARAGDKTLTVPELIKAMDNPLARAQAIQEIRRIGPNAVEYREALISLVQQAPLDEALADAAYSTDINAPHPSPWLDMREMFPVMKSIDEALAASTDPAWVSFRKDLDAWMMHEPKTNMTVARNLADDLGDVAPELRELFIQQMHEHAARLAELAFGNAAQ
jgi:RNA polymerase sigma factor (sigma-70 family)